MKPARCSGSGMTRGTTAEVIEVYDDEIGQEGGVVSTLVVDIE
jgi:hypothetical protein